MEAPEVVVVGLAEPMEEVVSAAVVASHHLMELPALVVQMVDQEGLDHLDLDPAVVRLHHSMVLLV